MEEEERIFHRALHLLAVGYEIGRDVAAVKLHAFHHFDGGFGALGLVNGDYAFFLDLFHGLGDEAADGLVIVGRYAGHVFDFLEIVAHFLTHALDGGHHCGHGLVDAALQIHGIGAGSHIFQAYVDDRLGQDGGGGGAVAGVIAGFRGHFLHELRAHVLERILKLDFAGHAYAVFGDVGGAEFLLDDYIAAFRAKGYLDGVGKSVNAFFEFFTC